MSHFDTKNECATQFQFDSQIASIRYVSFFDPGSLKWLSFYADAYSSYWIQDIRCEVTKVQWLTSPESKSQRMSKGG